MVVARIGQGSQPMSEGDRVGARVVARLSSGVPTDRAIIDGLPDRWLALADELERTQPEARRGVRKRHLDSWEDGRAMLAAILQVNPAEDPRTEPVEETPIRQRFALRSVADIKAMPPLRWQIDNHIPRGALVVQFGPSGSGKTFEAIEQACCTTSGVAWHGLERVESGTVVYVAAEGVGGLNKRLAAWEKQHPDADLSRLHFITEPVNLLDPLSVDAFKVVLRTLPERPAAVFIDTLARCLVGGDENSAKDMGLAIASVDGIRAEFDATVYIIHHTGKNGEAERGSSALRAAADVMIQVSGDNERVSLTCSKMKDAEPFKVLNLSLTPVEGTDSCVLEYIDARSAPIGEMSPSARKVAAVLDSHFTAEGASMSQWVKAAYDAHKVSEPTVYRCRRDLEKSGFIAKDRTRYVLTAAGRSELGLPESDPGDDAAITITELSNDYHDSQETTITTITTLRGDSGDSSRGVPVGASGRKNGTSGRKKSGATFGDHFALGMAAEDVKRTHWGDPVSLFYRHCCGSTGPIFNVMDRTGDPTDPTLNPEIRHMCGDCGRELENRDGGFRVRGGES